MQLRWVIFLLAASAFSRPTSLFADSISTQPSIETSRMRAIFDAIQQNDVQSFHSLLKRNPQAVFSRDEVGNTPLHAAALNSRSDMVRLLLASGADVNATNLDEVTPLHVASDKDVAELLLAHNADVNFKDDAGRTPLDEQISWERWDVVKLLIAHKAREDVRVAAAIGDVGTVKALLRSNPDLISASDSNGDTPLHFAAKYGHKDVTEYFLAHQADPNTKDKGGETPLHLAAQKGNKEVVEVLLANKADVNARDNHGSTPLHFAADGGNEQIADILVANGADSNAKNNDGDTPLHDATSAGVAEVLLKHGADVNAKNNNGETPLRAAQFRNLGDVVQVLRQHGGI